jgi:predicted  nucleic acid-binding Zn-ribbon protein
VSFNQYPEWIKCNELNALQSQEIIALKDRIKQLEDELNAAKELIKRLEVAAWKNYNNSHKSKEAKP